MLTQTSELAIRSLLFIVLEANGRPLGPKTISQRLHCSPLYLAKVLGLLVKAGILRSVRGAKGGILLARSPDEIKLLAIVEAAQGILIGNYCEEIAGHHEPVCAFHQAMKEIHRATVDVLSRWTLADLAARPTPDHPQESPLCCNMAFEGCEKYYGAGNSVSKT